MYYYIIIKQIFICVLLHFFSSQKVI